MTEDNQVGAPLAATHRQPRLAALGFVRDEDSDALVLNGPLRGESFLHVAVVGVPVDGVEAVGRVVEGVEGGFAREIARVNDGVGPFDGLGGPPGEFVAGSTVGV